MKAAGSFPDHSFGCEHQNSAQLPTLRCLQPVLDLVSRPQALSATPTHTHTTVGKKPVQQSKEEKQRQTSAGHTEGSCIFKKDVSVTTKRES